LLGYRVFFRDWKGELPSPEAFVAALPDLYPRILLSALYGNYSRQFAAERWGDKSPIYTVHVDLLSQIFPSAQFIHVIRDGRDVALSMLKSYRGARFFYIDLYFAASSWKWRVSRARSSGVRLGSGRYHEIRYEQLVADPAKILSGICAFLGEAYVPDMAEPYKIARELYHSKGIHSATRRSLSTQSVGRWKTEMSGADQRLFHKVAGDLIEQLGYETPDLGSMGLAETSRFIGLRSKYILIDTGRSLLQSTGVFHPTSLIPH
jgi:hypothetical protein